MFGVALVSAWCVMPAAAGPLTQKTLASQDQKAILHAISYGQNERPARGVLEFPVRDAVPLETPMEIDHFARLDNTELPLDLPSCSSTFWQALREGAITVLQAGQRKTLTDVLAGWCQQYSCGPALKLQMVGWRTWTPLAQMMVHGALACDVLPVAHRAGGSYTATLTTEGPPTTLLKRYLEMEAL